MADPTGCRTETPRPHERRRQGRDTIHDRSPSQGRHRACERAPAGRLARGRSRVGRPDRGPSGAHLGRGPAPARAAARSRGGRGHAGRAPGRAVPCGGRSRGRGGERGAAGRPRRSRGTGFGGTAHQPERRAGPVRGDGPGAHARGPPSLSRLRCGGARAGRGAAGGGHGTCRDLAVVGPTGVRSPLPRARPRQRPDLRARACGRPALSVGRARPPAGLRAVEARGGAGGVPDRLQPGPRHRPGEDRHRASVLPCG